MGVPACFIRKIIGLISLADQLCGVCFPPDYRLRVDALYFFGANRKTFNLGCLNPFNLRLDSNCVGVLNRRAEWATENASVKLE